VGAGAEGGEDEADGVDADASFSRSTSDCFGYGKLAVPSSTGGGGTAFEACGDGDDGDEHPPSAGNIGSMTIRATPIHRPRVAIRRSIAQ